MPARPEQLLQHLRRLASAPAPDAEPDAALLAGFVRSRDEDAFAALVRRHGPMVLGVCRRILRDAHQAEDAFQAVWLVLARKAASVRPPDRLAAWLHGVARHVALKALRADARRRRRDEAGSAASSPGSPRDPLDELTARELLLLLDEEVSRLPEVYRVPVVLCCLQGKTQEEAARQLGWSAGQVKGRLERGRKRLHERLAGRGLTLAAALAAVEATRPLGAAALLPAATARAAAAFAAGSGTPAAGSSSQAVALAQAMLNVSARARLVVVLLLTGTLALAGMLVARTPISGRGSKEASAASPTRPSLDPRSSATDRHGDPLPPGVLTRLGTVRWRTTDPNSNAEMGFFSHDGKEFIAWWGRTVHVFDAATGRSRLRLGNDQGLGPLAGVALSPDGRTLVTVTMEPVVLDSSAFQVRRWDMASGRELPKGHGGTAPPGTRAVGFAGARALLVLPTAKADRTARLAVYDALTGKQLARLAGMDWHDRSVTFAPNGETLALRTDTGPVRLVDGKTLKEVRQLGPAKGRVGKVAYGPDGRTLATLDARGRLCVWEVATGKLVAEMTNPQEQFACAACLALSPDGKRIALGMFKDNTVRVHELKTGQEVQRFASPNSYISQLAYTPDGRTLAACSGSVILAWDVATGKARHAERDVNFRPVQCLAWSPDGRTVATGSGHHLHHAIRLWDARTGRELAAWPVPEPSTVGLYSLSFSPDGRYLVSCEWSTTRLWEVASGRCLRQWPRGTGFDPWAAFASDGRLAVVERRPDYSQEVVFRDPATGKELGRRAASGRWSMISSMAFAPGGRLLAVSGQPEQAKGRLLLWDPGAGREVEPPEDAGHEYKHLFFSPTADQLWGVLPERGLTMWDLPTRRKRMLPLKMARNYWAAGFSSDGRLLALAGAGDNGEEATLSLFELASGGRRWQMPLAMGPTRHLAFSPDGRWLATTHPDSTVLIWDLDALPAPKPASAALPAGELPRLWDSLTAGDAVLAHRSLRTLQGDRARAVALCKERLTPAPRVDGQRVARLIADLGSDRFAVREKAVKALDSLGAQAAPALLEARKGQLSLEASRRIDRLLAPLTQGLLSGQRLREVRAVELLERIGTPEAHALLEALARGAPEARLTREARAALKRVD
jgi:RNA polymerase sigma factor (sigma-70 family)